MAGYAYLLRANPYHDALGRFSTANSAKYVSLWAKAGKPKLMEPATTGAASFKNLEDPNNKEARQELAAKGAADIAGLLPAELKAVKDYTSHHYYEINGHHRGTYPAQTKEDRKQINDWTHNIDSALEKSSVGQHAMGYRGVDGQFAGGLIERFDEGKLVGSTLQDPGYVSATIDKTTAEGWSNRVNLHLKLKPEQQGLYVDSISAHKGENEILLPRNTQMVVTNAYRDTNKRLIIEVDVQPRRKNP